MAKRSSKYKKVEATEEEKEILNLADGVTNAHGVFMLFLGYAQNVHHTIAEQVKPDGSLPKKVTMTGEQVVAMHVLIEVVTAWIERHAIDDNPPDAETLLDPRHGLFKFPTDMKLSADEEEQLTKEILKRVQPQHGGGNIPA